MQTMVHTASGFTSQLAQQAELSTADLRQQAAVIAADHVQVTLSCLLLTHHFPAGTRLPVPSCSYSSFACSSRSSWALQAPN